MKSRNEDYFSNALKTETVLLAEINQRIVGFVQFGGVTYDDLSTNPEDLELNKIYVDTKYHGQGIGKKLMKSMVNHGRVKPTKDIYLDLYAKNDNAIGLYKKYGFVEIGRVPFKLDRKIAWYDVLMKSCRSKLTNVIQ